MSSNKKNNTYYDVSNHVSINNRIKAPIVDFLFYDGSFFFQCLIQLVRSNEFIISSLLYFHFYNPI